MLLLHVLQLLMVQLDHLACVVWGSRPSARWDREKERVGRPVALCAFARCCRVVSVMELEL